MSVISANSLCGVKLHIERVAADAFFKALVIMWNKGPTTCFTEQWKVVTAMLKTAVRLWSWILNDGAIRSHIHLSNQAEVDVTHRFKCTVLKMAATLRFLGKTQRNTQRHERRAGLCLPQSLTSYTNLWAAQLLLHHSHDHKVLLGHVAMTSVDLCLMTCMWYYLSRRGLSHVRRLV